MTAKEIWLTIKYNDNYEVSSLGNVRNKKTKRILKPAISNKGYYLVALSNIGINNANIVRCCKGKRKSAGGYIWKYN